MSSKPTPYAYAPGKAGGKLAWELGKPTGSGANLTMPNAANVGSDTDSDSSSTASASGQNRYNVDSESDSDNDSSTYRPGTLFQRRHTAVDNSHPSTGREKLIVDNH